MINGRTALQQPFIGREAFTRPMLAPTLERLTIDPQGRREVIAYPWHYQRMCIGNRHQRESASVGTFLGVLRQ